MLLLSLKVTRGSRSIWLISAQLSQQRSWRRCPARPEVLPHLRTFPQFVSFFHLHTLSRSTGGENTSFLGFSFCAKVLRSIAEKLSAHSPNRLMARSRATGRFNPARESKVSTNSLYLDVGSTFTDRTSEPAPHVDHGISRLPSRPRLLIRRVWKSARSRGRHPNSQRPTTNETGVSCPRWDVVSWQHLPSGASQDPCLRQYTNVSLFPGAGRPSKWMAEVTGQ